MTRLIHHPGHPLADAKGWVEKNEDYYNNLPEVDSCGRPYIKSDSAHNVISDIMDSTRHMANNKYYDSKSEFRKATKAAGCIEVGNDSSIMTQKPRKTVELDRRQRREDIKRSLYELKNRG